MDLLSFLKERYENGGDINFLWEAVRVCKEQSIITGAPVVFPRWVTDAFVKLAEAAVENGQQSFPIRLDSEDAIRLIHKIRFVFRVKVLVAIDLAYRVIQDHIRNKYIEDSAAHVKIGTLEFWYDHIPRYSYRQFKAEMAKAKVDIESERKNFLSSKLLTEHTKEEIRKCQRPVKQQPKAKN